MLANFIIIC